MRRLQICHQPGCAWTYTQPVRFRAHLATVHGVGDRHCCARCNKTYARADDLRRHVKARHGQASMIGFPCPNCMKVFKEERTMKTHQKAVCRMVSVADGNLQMLAYEPLRNHCTSASAATTARQWYENSKVLYGGVVDLDGSVSTQHENENAEHDIISPQARRLTGSMALDAGRTSRQLVHRSRNRQVRQDRRKALRYRLRPNGIIGSPCYTVSLDGSSVEDYAFVADSLYWTASFFYSLRKSEMAVAQLLLGTFTVFVAEHYDRLLRLCRNLLSVFHISDPGNIAVLSKLQPLPFRALYGTVLALLNCAMLVGDNNGIGRHKNFNNALSEAWELQHGQDVDTADDNVYNVSEWLPAWVSSMLKDILGHCNNFIEEKGTRRNYIWYVDDDDDVIMRSTNADWQGSSELLLLEEEEEEDDDSEGTESSEAGDCLSEVREDPQDAAEDVEQSSTGLLDVEGRDRASQLVLSRSTPVLCSGTESDDVEMMMEIEQDGIAGVVEPFQPAYDALECFEASEFYSPLTNLSFMDTS